MPSDADRIHVEIRERDGTLSVDSAIVILRALVGLLRSIESEMDDADAIPLRWGIEEATKQSPFKVAIRGEVPAGVRGKSASSNSVMLAAVRGLEYLETTGFQPPHFSDASLAKARLLVRPLGNDVAGIRVFVDDVSVTITQRVAASVDEILNRPDRFFVHAIALEGILGKNNVHGTLEFSLYDVLDDHEIECTCDEALFEKMRDNLRSRVIVIGVAKYDRKVGRAISMQVTDIRPARKRPILPKLSDIPPMNITGGLPSEEHIRRLRNDQ